MSQEDTLPRTTFAVSRRREHLFAPEVYREDAQAPRGADERTRDEIARLRSELRVERRTLRAELSRSGRPAELVAEIATLRAVVDELLLSRRGDAVATMIRMLGFEGPAAAALARTAKEMRGGDAALRLRSAAVSMIDVTDEPLALASDGRALLGFVGPAGVGKTTTAAKIAARARMAKKSVALVSCDSFRVGAMDQLGKYAHLMGARFHTATTRSELLAIVRSEDADVVIIDTSGRAVEPGSTEALLGASELRAAGGRKTGVLLCVPAALRAADATRVRRDFASSKPSALVVTKLDETDTPAGILHAWFAARLPVSACCTGQRVPEDLTPATPGLIGFSLVPDRKGAAK